MVKIALAIFSRILQVIKFEQKGSHFRILKVINFAYSERLGLLPRALPPRTLSLLLVRSPSGSISRLSCKPRRISFARMSLGKGGWRVGWSLRLSDCLASVRKL